MRKLIFATLFFLLAGIGVASAQYVGGGSIGAAGGGGSFSGGVLTTLLTFSGLATDITTATNENLTLSSNGTGSVQLMSGDGTTDILDSAGTVRGEIVTRSGANEAYLKSAPATSGIFKVETSVATAGSTGAVGAGSSAFIVADGINTSTGGTAPLLRVYGEGTLQPVPSTARTITSPTDTTTDPTAGGTSCRMSSSGAAAWTPAESGGVTGMFICCTNTGANDITMTDSDGVYEGPGSVVGQWDTVCFSYVTDRWVEQSFSNNEP